MTSRIGSFVRQMREQAMMTQQDVARRAGLSRSYLSRLETGNIASPSADFLFRIGRALGVHPDLFFKAAGYGPTGLVVGEERKVALAWIDSETSTWSGDELSHWARLMVHCREATREWRAGPSATV